jgi:hypothetical protein
MDVISLVKTILAVSVYTVARLLPESSIFRIRIGILLEAFLSCSLLCISAGVSSLTPAPFVVLKVPSTISVPEIAFIC